ncbi:N-acetylmuramoyl-L-alanine amidase [Romboutsia sp. 13368]|uniref:N-acetylmuramoyl-L-alanine amidase n=1 Tax=Romboutsia sp. 13368 TaxID=2708053 RepID=UPI0025E39427|nr:N-acetylmuramoyl-L-alanine amidase [Romboutsia sp. 13368]
MLKSKFQKIALTSILTTMLSSNFLIANAESYKVFIDAGHGGKDNGASHNGYLEDVINLQIAHKLKNRLINEGLEVEMSRNSDTSLSLSERAAKSNNSDADIFISIHQNASSSPSANGIETYYLGSRNKALATAVHNSIINSTSANDRSVREANFQVLRDNNKVSILLECGFISNPSEGYKLNTDEYQNKVVDGIVSGVKNYFNINNNNVNTSNSSNSNKNTDRGKNFNIIGTLPQGAKVKIIDTKFDWHKIEFNGKYGYVSGVYVK